MWVQNFSFLSKCSVIYTFKVVLTRGSSKLLAIQISLTIWKIRDKIEMSLMGKTNIEHWTTEF